jgi:CBS domain-containing protein
VARVVGDVMTRDVVALTDAHDAAAFASLLVEHGVKSVPVVQGDRVVGIVGRRDLLRLLARDDDAVLADLQALLAAEQTGVGSWQATVADGAVVLVGAGSPEQVEGVRLLATSVPGVVRVDVREG